MSALLNSEVIDQVKEAFQDLEEPVHMLFFDGSNCQYCQDTKQLIEEVAAISELITIEEFHLEEDPEAAERYNIDKAPGLVIASQDGNQVTDYGIRYAGIPSGHEFSSLIQDLLIVSSKQAGLSPETMDFLQGLEEPVHLQVFVTPTCPYCPRAVILAHRFALASDMVQAEMVESSEFQNLVSKYQVSGVPDTSINHGAGRVVGAVPEKDLVAEIKKVLTR
ncbi:MAG: thioredoxin family protein [Anaerolineales bacterium]|nr:thioredoxin family protein [Anaerolineales bacterium]